MGLSAMCGFVRDQKEEYLEDELMQQVIGIAVAVVYEAWSDIPDDEQLKIIDIARAEMKKLLQCGLPSLYNAFHHRLPYNGKCIFHITGTGEEVKLDGLMPCE